MNRCCPVVLLLLSACTTEGSLPGPIWDIGAEPQAGYTYEGRVAAFVTNGRPESPIVDESNLHLITWPEGTVVPATLSWPPARGIRQDIEIEPASSLEPDRWYAIRWDSAESRMPTPMNYLLGSAERLDDDSFAWPFWSTSGPILFSLGWDRAVSLVMVAYSDQVEPGPAYVGTVTQGDTVCRLDSFTTSATIEGSCASLDLSLPVELHLSGLRSAGTGIELPAVDRELMLAADGGARLGNRLEWPAFEGVP